MRKVEADGFIAQSGRMGQATRQKKCLDFNQGVYDWEFYVFFFLLVCLLACLFFEQDMGPSWTSHVFLADVS